MNDFIKKCVLCDYKTNWTQTWQLCAFYYDVLLLTTAYSAYAVHFFLCQFPNYGIDVIVVVAFISNTELLYFLRLRHFGCYNSVFDRLSMHA